MTNKLTYKNEIDLTNLIYKKLRELALIHYNDLTEYFDMMEERAKEIYCDEVLLNLAVLQSITFCQAYKGFVKLHLSNVDENELNRFVKRIIPHLTPNT